MKYLIKKLLLVTACVMISCTGEVNPLTVQQEQPILICGGCFSVGIMIDFADTCSYDFVIDFLSRYDSVQISETYLGVNLYLYADSGNFAYWSEYFYTDTSFMDLNMITRSDSLLLIFRFLNEAMYVHEKDRLISLAHLHFVEAINEVKIVVVQVPEGSEMYWLEIFRQFEFIEATDWISICYDS